MNSSSFEGLPPETARKLRETYQKGIPEKLQQMRVALDAFKLEKSKEHLTSLRFLVHKTAGSAGSFGYPTVSEICKKWEKSLVEALTEGRFDNPQLYQDAETYLAEVQKAFGIVI